eukprot:CAMPEP_0194176488 /NCGR_PEP_ID=MMETSP0154-20130528/10388_1 /TAXON_ID=1049557 /ORGANISM="Thalassiothrix antarctica, Strain L6-D1" /LENGTH=348 /DNA_ID=CAMNT_0038890673 /DNA_START=86 /DNA_END=1132 /DNA_ORIENTATION=-
MSFIASVLDSFLYGSKSTRCSTFQCPCGAIRCELRVPASSYKLMEQTSALYRQTDLVNFCKACPNGDFVLHSDDPDATHLVSYYKSDIHILKGHDKIKAVKVDNKTSVIRLYCDSCGTPLGYEVMSSPITMLHSKLISSDNDNGNGGPVFIPTHIIGSIPMIKGAAAATLSNDDDMDDYENNNNKTLDNNTSITSITFSSPLSFSGRQEQQTPAPRRRRRGLVPPYYVGIGQLSSTSLFNFSFFSWKVFGRTLLGYLFQKQSYGGMYDPRYYSIIPIGYDKIQIHTSSSRSTNSLTSNITSSAMSVSSKRSYYDQAVQNKLEELEEEENDLLDMIQKIQSKVESGLVD